MRYLVSDTFSTKVWFMSFINESRAKKDGCKSNLCINTHIYERSKIINGKNDWAELYTHREREREREDKPDIW